MPYQLPGERKVLSGSRMMFLMSSLRIPCQIEVIFMHLKSENPKCGQAFGKGPPCAPEALRPFSGTSVLLTWRQIGRGCGGGGGDLCTGICVCLLFRVHGGGWMPLGPCDCIVPAAEIICEPSLQQSCALWGRWRNDSAEPVFKPEMSISELHQPGCITSWLTASFITQVHNPGTGDLGKVRTAGSVKWMQPCIAVKGSSCLQRPTDHAHTHSAAPG